MCNPGRIDTKDNLFVFGDRVIIKVEEDYQIGMARRKAKDIAQALGFSMRDVMQLATSVSELGANLFFHTNGGGRILLGPVRARDKVGIEVISEDDGPGIENLNLALQDGYSTRNGLGGGLPGVRRLMDTFAIESSRDSGTRVTAVKWKRCVGSLR